MPYISKINPASVYTKDRKLLSILAFDLMYHIGHIQSIDDEKLRNCSNWQQLAYLYFFFDFKIDGYGFLLLFNMNCGKYFPLLLELLNLLENEKTKPLITEAYNIYLANQAKIDATIGKDPFDLLNDFKDLEALSSQFNQLSPKTCELIEKHLKKHFHTYFNDLEGNKIDLKYTGFVQDFYENEVLKSEFEVEKGKIKGLFKSYNTDGILVSTSQKGTTIFGMIPCTTYFANGKIETKTYFIDGEWTIMSEIYAENGVLLAQQKRKTDDYTHYENKDFYENGTLKSQTIYYQINHENEIFEINFTNTFFENGEIEELNTLVQNTDIERHTVNFYANGQKKSEYIFIYNKKVLFQNFWEEDGTQTCKNGNGIFNHYSAVIEVQNGVEHGKTSCYNEGKLWYDIFYEHGEEINRIEYPMNF